MSNIEISELWKYIAAIAVSCAISFAGYQLSNSFNYTTREEVNTLINAKIVVLENEMKHYDTTLKGLSSVVDNNNKVMMDLKAQLIKFEIIMESWKNKSNTRNETNFP